MDDQLAAVESHPEGCPICGVPDEFAEYPWLFWCEYHEPFPKPV
jgi:hypothetical protein